MEAALEKGDRGRNDGCGCGVDRGMGNVELVEELIGLCRGSRFA